jgi:hypothetical protein|tara:strand:+ start:176 stop:715 length:540 start_codon:yes stop_codon:yes gene_type:complete
MACNVTAGRVLPCKAGFGGIKAAYFFDLDALGALTYTDGVITTIAGTPTVYEYDVKNTSSLETAINSSRETGTTFYEQTLSLTLTYLDAPTQEQIKLIAWGRPSVAVEDYYGNMFIAGLENGMEMTGGTIGTGTQPGDLSGFTMTLVGQEVDPATFITSTLVTGATQGTKIDPTSSVTP